MQSSVCVEMCEILDEPQVVQGLAALSEVLIFSNGTSGIHQIPWNALKAGFWVLSASLQCARHAWPTGPGQRKKQRYSRR